MFNQLFLRSDGLNRALSAPLVEERRQYLTQCASQGMSTKTLLVKSRILLSIVEYLRLEHRPEDRIAIAEIEDAARRWSTHNWHSTNSRHVKNSRGYFITYTVEWLSLLIRLESTPPRLTVCDHLLTEFKIFMREDRGFSPQTVEYRCVVVRSFLKQLLEGKSSLVTITVSDIDSLLLQKVNEEHYGRTSVRAYASSLRSFFDTPK
jgi:integrase/recombinase XerD